MKGSDFSNPELHQLEVIDVISGKDSRVTSLPSQYFPFLLYQQLAIETPTIAGKVSFLELLLSSRSEFGEHTPRKFSCLMFHCVYR